jgi:hypothetical protein
MMRRSTEIGILCALLLLGGCPTEGGDDDTTEESPVDADGDGFYDDEDCDDFNGSVYPGADEGCNDVDNDCDGALDPDEEDLDGDGYRPCEGDCDDADATSLPGGEEVCDGADNDCDGTLLDHEEDLDGDGWYACDGTPAGGDCDDEAPDTYPGAEELCDDLDNDCDGSPSPDEADADGDGFRGCDGDCDDADGETYPGALDLCDGGVDNDCDPTTDEEADDDGDGYRICDGDCDDGYQDVNPGADEVCGNGVDDDCDGTDNGCGWHGVATLGTMGATVIGEASGDAAGAVAGAGDVNGDGLDDVLVGARYNDAAGTDAGVVYVLFGGSIGGDMELANAYGKLLGEAEGDNAGFSVAGAGDVDGDGVDDVLVGAHRDDTNGAEAGAAYLLYGGQLVGEIDLADADAKYLGEVADSYAGRVAGVGDADGDGLGDFLVGAYHDSASGLYAGAAYLVLGGGATGVLELEDAEAKLLGELDNDYAGCAVSGAGDVDGDGLADLLVGAYRHDEGGSSAGSAYLLQSPVSGEVELGDADGEFLGEEAHDLAGWAVATAGDINGDGLDDVLVGAYEHTAGGDHAGAAWLIHGPADGTIDLADADGKFVGEAEWDYAGIAVAPAGDVNGDGVADFLIGAKFDTSGNGAGAAYLIYGPMEGVVDLSASSAKFMGEVTLDEAGRYLAAAGDVNGDGFDDIVIGAPAQGAGGTEAGAAYVVYGAGM